MEIANFFWDGQITELEKNCIQSFVRNGFYAKLWTYDQSIQIPNVETCDANLVLNRNLKLRQANNSKTDTAALLAAFSDYFRYKVVNIFGGWWFDTDCYCLKNSEEYLKVREGKKIISCKQTVDDLDFHNIGTGGFYIEKDVSDKLINEFEDIISKIGESEQNFGFFGPEFFTRFVKENGFYDNMLPYKEFYSIHWDEVELMIYPQNLSLAEDRVKDSMLTHIWTTQFSARGIDKNYPINGSFLKKLYDKNK